MTYQIDLEMKAITQSEAAWSAAPDVIAHSPEIPKMIDKAIANESLAKKYELSYRMNPPICAETSMVTARSMWPS